MARGRCFIGTSGWSYKHWRGPFYPAAWQGRRSALLLCRAVRHGRGQRHLLPADRGRHLPALARADARGLRVRLQGQPLSHPHEAPQGRGAGRRPLLRAGRGARGQARPDRVPAARPLQTRPRAPRGVHRRAPGRASLRLRVPRPGLVPARDLRSARRRATSRSACTSSPGRRRRSRSPRASSTSACTAPRALPGLLQRRGAADLGQAHPRLGQKGLDVYCYFDNDDRGFAPQERFGSALRRQEILDVDAQHLGERSQRPGLEPRFLPFSISDRLALRDCRTSFGQSAERLRPRCSRQTRTGCSPPTKNPLGELDRSILRTRPAASRARTSASARSIGGILVSFDQSIVVAAAAAPQCHRSARSAPRRSSVHAPSGIDGLNPHLSCATAIAIWMLLPEHARAA